MVSTRVLQRQGQQQFQQWGPQQGTLDSSGILRSSGGLVVRGASAQTAGGVVVVAATLDPARSGSRLALVLALLAKVLTTLHCTGKSRLDDLYCEHLGPDLAPPIWPGLSRSGYCVFETSMDAVHYCDSAGASFSFTLDSGTSQCFFRDHITLTPLAAPVSVALADPSSGPAVARSSTTLLCPGVPSGVLTGLYIPSFSPNLVGAGYLQDHGITIT
ncbi:unnamed protein product [Closterium sp. NIES-54]